MDRLTIIRRATNLQDNKSLVLHPASTIFSDYSPDDRSAMRVPDSLLRLAVGIEDADDLWNDISQALEGA
jgi:O-acetylhomoserine (thiol)-lyase